MPSLSHLSPKTIVKESLIHGKGLFAQELILKGKIVCIKGGHIFNRETLVEAQRALGSAEIQIAENLLLQSKIDKNSAEVAVDGAL